MTTSWLSAVGLGVEIAGLLCLFFDLWKSKGTAARTEAFRDFQQQIDRQSQDLIVGTYKAFSTLATVIQQYFMLKDQAQRQAQGQEQEMSASDREMMARDPEFAAFMKAISPQNLADLTEKTLKRARESIRNPEEVNEDVRKITALRLQIDGEFIALADFAELLRRIAYTGIALVLLGAALQFADLVFV